MSVESVGKDEIRIIGVAVGYFIGKVVAREGDTLILTEVLAIINNPQGMSLVAFIAGKVEDEVEFNTVGSVIVTPDSDLITSYKNAAEQHRAAKSNIQVANSGDLQRFIKK